MSEQTNKPRDYDERIYRKGNPPHRARIAIIAIIAVVVGTYFAWTKELPFGNPYTLKAVFANAVKIRTDSPVRVAGVNVGKVLTAERVDGVSQVTFTVDQAGQPVHDDAYAQIRPRIFLEGNFFIDLRPGSPNTPELASGDTIPITQTATSVQIDEVLTALQSDDRQNLVETLSGLGTALNEEPTSSTSGTTDDTTVVPVTGGEALNAALDYGAQAGRDSAIVNEALQGTEPDDLRNLLRSNAIVLGVLAANEQSLQSLITNYATFTGALAAESKSLKAAVGELGPTMKQAEPSLRHLNETLPALRAWTRGITPGLRELPDTITTGTPWLTQASQLLQANELAWTASQLAQTGQPAGRTGVFGPGVFTQTERFSKCGTEVLIPTGNTPIQDSGTDTFSTGNPSYMDFFYSAVNLSGATQGFDGNGRFFRTQPGGGPTSISATNPEKGPQNLLWGNAMAAPLGTRPVLDLTGGTTQPAFSTSALCQDQSIPNLNGPAAAVGAPSPQAEPFPFGP